MYFQGRKPFLGAKNAENCYFYKKYLQNVPQNAFSAFLGLKRAILKLVC